MVKLGINLNVCDFSHYVVLLIFSSSVKFLTATPIVGGTVIQTEGDTPRYPFMVSLQECVVSSNSKTIEYQHYCGGSLISKNWILTAAHCVYPKNIWQIAAVVGQENISIAQQLSYHKIRTAIYCDFSPSNLQNDIALLQLEEEPENLPDWWIFGQLPSYDMKLYSQIPCQIIGYGATQNGGNIQSELRKAEVNVISNKKCEAIIGRVWAPQNGENTVCALGVKQDTCQGDSGGPLICSHDGREYISGIVSHGIQCGIAGVPGIYTETLPYLEWINSIIYTKQ